MAVQIQLRNDTAANWTTANPILAVGEMGVETDTDLFKLGNGIDHWVDLPYGGLQGPTGPAGPTGPPGDLVAGDIPALVAYTHNQIVASNLWTIVHNLDFYPQLTVFDSAGSMVEGAVTHTDETTLTIAFSAAISGIAHLS